VNAWLFEELRPVGFAVAYRILGSASEREDGDCDLLTSQSSGAYAKAART
jgi:hypothetical protein